MTNGEIVEKSILETVLHYKYMEDNFPNSGMLREVKHQYADMASGGDGGVRGSRSLPPGPPWGAPRDLSPWLRVGGGSGGG